ncbi:hypothetical protein H4Q26_008275 [Puccinia striiformis f. sp. tritici PST-130]|nr:hypothetical protein H4Q26_008275 [Puccinia striiformis f. sp. tritici PST-130]
MCIEHTPPISEISEKLLYIGKVIAKFNLDPKRYITAFLQNQHKQIVLHHGCGGPKLDGARPWRFCILSRALFVKPLKGKAGGVPTFSPRHRKSLPPKVDHMVSFPQEPITTPARLLHSFSMKKQNRIAWLV